MKDSQSMKEDGGVSFSRALMLLKDGKMVRRTCWVGQRLSATTLTNIVDAKDIWNVNNREFATQQPDQQVGVTPYITMQTDDGMLSMGWVPTSEDLFADDWIIAVL